MDFVKTFWHRMRLTGELFSKKLSFPQNRMIQSGLWFGLVFAVGCLLWGILLLSPLTQQAGFFQSNTLFQANQTFPSQSIARGAYKEALELLKKHQWDAAWHQFKALGDVYPALAPWLSLHQAEAAEHLPREDWVQASLLQALSLQPHSGLRPQLLYRLGQSYLRSAQPEAAQQQFLTLRRHFPHTEYGRGALYYLRQLQNNDSLGWQYLAEVPSGRFSLALSQEYLMQKQKKTPSQRFWLARVLAELALNAPAAEQQTQCRKALVTLKQLPTAHIWPWLGLCQSLIAPEGRERQENATWHQALMQPAFWSALPAMSEENQNRLFQRVAVSKSLQLWYQHPAKTPLPIAVGDRLLWHLAQHQQGHARRQTLTRLIEQYPKSRYAAESLWETKIRPLILVKNDSKLLTLSEAFLAKFPNVNRSPDVQLWRGHALRQRGDLSGAKAQYQDILSRYPLSYAAYRADRWLHALALGNSSADWSIAEMSATSVLPEMKTLLTARPITKLAGLHQLPQAEKNALNELQRIEAWSDIQLWAQDSRLAQVSARQKTILLALSDLGQSHMASGLHALKDTWLSPGPSRRLLYQFLVRYQLAYPWLPPDSNLYSEATQNGLPPILALSLLREESYFNPEALSHSGARGLMQLMPATAQEVARRAGLSGFKTDDLYVPPVNIRLGCQYLGDLLRQMHGHPMLAVAAYNAGPGAVSRWLAARPSSSSRDESDWFAETIPAQETREYVRKVFSTTWAYHLLYQQQERAE
ncbi:MAG: transglycosylase SLT domain-containing protein [Vampirovibrionales bacterium]|nr:transglycosylase SLT domain-containing protein [Vampirovibrionales bacterium]